MCHDVPSLMSAAMILFVSTKSFIDETIFFARACLILWPMRSAWKAKVFMCRYLFKRFSFLVV